MKIKVNFLENEEHIHVCFGEIQVVDTLEVDIYEGEYTVTPKVTAQSLDTRNKYMQSDVTVYAIPYHAVSNNSGGLTATIGGV